jgi:hypothetical protein
MHIIVHHNQYSVKDKQLHRVCSVWCVGFSHIGLPFSAECHTAWSSHRIDQPASPAPHRDRDGREQGMIKAFAGHFGPSLRRHLEKGTSRSNRCVIDRLPHCMDFRPVCPRTLPSSNTMLSLSGCLVDSVNALPYAFCRSGCKLAEHWRGRPPKAAHPRARMRQLTSPYSTYRRLVVDRIERAVMLE